MLKEAAQKEEVETISPQMIVNLTGKVVSIILTNRKHYSFYPSRRKAQVVDASYTHGTVEIGESLSAEFWMPIPGLVGGLPEYRDDRTLYIVNPDVAKHPSVLGRTDVFYVDPVHKVLVRP